MKATWSIAKRTSGTKGFIDERIYETSDGYDIANGTFLAMRKPSDCLYLIFSYSDAYSAVELAIRY